MPSRTGRKPLFTPAAPSRKDTLSKPLHKILERAENAHQITSGHIVSCPAADHGQGRGDREASVSVKQGEDERALVHCFGGCKTEDVMNGWGLTMADLFEKNDNARTLRKPSQGGGGSSISQENKSTDQHPDDGITLEGYAEYVSLPAEFLKSLGLSEMHYGRSKAVRIPYLDEAGAAEALIRFRVSLSGKPKIKTRKNDKHQLYGL